MRAKWRKMKLLSMVEKSVEKVWKSMAWATYDGDVPVLKAWRSSCVGGCLLSEGTGVYGR